MNLDAEILTLNRRVGSLEEAGSALTQRIGELELALKRPPSVSNSAVSVMAPPVVASPNPPPQTPPPPGFDGSDPPVRPPPPQPNNAFPPPPQAPSSQPAPVFAGSSFSITSEALLRWAGLTLVSLAAIFFVSTAMNRGWVGPKLQLGGATAVGVAFHSAAIALKAKATKWAFTLTHGATVVLAWSAAASYQWLGLVSIEVGLGLVAVAAMGSTAIAIKFRFSTVALSAGLLLALMPLWMDVFNSVTALTVAVWYCGVGVGFSTLGLWCRWPEVRLSVTWVSTGLLLLAFMNGGAFDGSLGQRSGLAALTGLSAALWVGPWSQSSFTSSRTPVGFRRLVEAFDHRLTLTLPVVYLAGVAALVSSGVPSGIGQLGLVVAAGFTAILLVVTVLAPSSVIKNRSLNSSAQRSLKPTGHRLALPNSLTASHLFGIGTVLVIAALELLDGPTLLVVVALQAVGTAAIAIYLKDTFIGVKALVLGLVSSLISTVRMVETVSESDAIDIGETVANFGVVAALVGFGVLARFLELELGTTKVVAEGIQEPRAWQWWSRDRFLVEVVDGMAWALGLLWAGSVVTLVVEFSLDPGLLAAFAGLSIVAYRFLGRVVLAIGVVLSALAGLTASIGIPVAYIAEFDFVDHSNHLSVVVAVLAATLWAWKPRANTDDEVSNGGYRLLAQEPFRSLLFVASWIGGLGWTGSVIIHGPQGQVAVSATWAVAGCMALLAGIRCNQSTIRLAGLSTLVIVVLKLLSVDLAEVDTLWRVGLFFVLGLGFMRLGYVLPALTNHYSTSELAEPHQSLASDQRSMTDTSATNRTSGVGDQ